MEIQQEKHSENALKRDAKGRLVKGTPPGPGRPKGKTIKERVREWLEEHPDDMKSFVEHFVKDNRELAWQMMEGKPKETGEYEVKIPKPIDDVLQDLGLQENKTAPQENPSNTGGNVGQQDSLDHNLADSAGAK